jgi:hypothetical protein
MKTDVIKSSLALLLGRVRQANWNGARSRGGASMCAIGVRGICCSNPGDPVRAISSPVKIEIMSAQDTEGPPA